MTRAGAELEAASSSGRSWQQPTDNLFTEKDPR